MWCSTFRQLPVLQCNHYLRRDRKCQFLTRLFPWDLATKTHLAGAFAGNSTLPVIGIPMKGGAADGLDALLATVQMPSGIPVATVAINGAKNAAVLAAQILAVSDDALAAKLDAQRSEMAEQIAAKEAKLQAELAH